MSAGRWYNILVRHPYAWYEEEKAAYGEHWQRAITEDRRGCESQWHGTDYLFIQDGGWPMHPDSINAWLDSFAKQNKLPPIHPHKFRHTQASLLIYSGADVVSVSKRLGHAKTSTTTDIYAHIIEDADEKNTELLAGALLRKA